MINNEYKYKRERIYCPNSVRLVTFSCLHDLSWGSIFFLDVCYVIPSKGFVEDLLYLFLPWLDFCRSSRIPVKPPILYSPLFFLPFSFAARLTQNRIGRLVALPTASLQPVLCAHPPDEVRLPLALSDVLYLFLSPFFFGPYLSPLFLFSALKRNSLIWKRAWRSLNRHSHTCALAHYWLLPCFDHTYTHRRMQTDRHRQTETHIYAKHVRTRPFFWTQIRIDINR